MNVLGKLQNRNKPFLFQKKKEVTKIDKGFNESVVTISYKINYIEIVRFMASSLSNLVDNFAEGNSRTIW